MTTIVCILRRTVLSIQAKYVVSSLCLSLKSKPGNKVVLTGESESLRERASIHVPLFEVELTPNSCSCECKIFLTGVIQKVLPVLSTETLLHIWLSTEYYGFRPSSTAVDTGDTGGLMMSK